MQVDGRDTTVLVSGAASGIGRACAEAFAAAGARVAALDLTRPASGHLRIVADVTDEDAVTAAIGVMEAEFGRLDVLVGCAGISGPFGVEVTEIALADWRRVLDVNVTGQFLLVKHALPLLRRSPGAAVVFLGSDSGFVAAPGMVPYCVSKGALVQLTRALAVELAPFGIRVCSVCPSIVDTPMSRSDLGDAAFATAAFPVLAPAQVAAQVLHLASPASSAVNGINLVADFGYLARSSYPA